MNPAAASESGVLQNLQRQSALAPPALGRGPAGDLPGSFETLSEARAASAMTAGVPVRPKIIQRMDDPRPERANAQALEDLRNGADGLALVFDGAPNAFGQGLPHTPEALATALRDVPLTTTHLRVDAHPQSRASVDWLVQLLSTRRVSPERLDISFGLDPAAIFAGTGRLRMSIEAMLASLPQSLAHFFALGVPGILLEADGRPFHNAGATEAQELGVMLASAVTYLRMFEEARQPVLYAAAHIGFSVSIDQDRSRTAAKLHALRLLWARVLESYGVPAMQPVIHAETSYRMLVSGAPEANRARNMLAAIAAIEGGVATLSMLAGTQPLSLADPQSRRGSLESLLVLANEGNIAQPVAHEPDGPADALAERAWEEVTRIESEGGVLRSLRDGHIQSRIRQSRLDMAERLREGSEEFSPASRHGLAAAPAIRASLPDASLDDAAVTCERLPVVRLEELLEEPD